MEYYPVFSAKRASERSRPSPKEIEMEGVRVRWKVREQIWPQETYTQALIPLSHRGGEPQALPSALPLDFSDQTMAQRQP